MENNGNNTGGERETETASISGPRLLDDQVLDDFYRDRTIANAMSKWVLIGALFGPLINS